jgi:hypothetical protein
MMDPSHYHPRLPSQQRDGCKTNHKLLLHGLRQDGSIDIRVCWGFGSELVIKVFRVTSINLDNVRTKHD